MAATTVKQAAQALVERLEDDASWDDLMEMIRVRMAIERGLADVEAGRTISHAEVLRRFGPVR